MIDPAAVKERGDEWFARVYLAASAYVRACHAEDGKRIAAAYLTLGKVMDEADADMEKLFAPR